MIESNDVKRFFNAIKDSDLDTVEDIIRVHQTILTVLEQGKSCLRIAIENGNAHMVDFFLKKGLKVESATTQDGKTGVMVAAESGFYDCLELLLNEKVNLEITYGSRQETALMLATQQDRKGCLEFLIKKGAHMNKLSRDGKTALHIAAEKGHANCLQSLITNKANYNLPVQDEIGDTALMLAVRNGHSACKKILIDAGARVNLKNLEHQTVFDIEKQQAHLLSVEKGSHGFFAFTQKPSSLTHEESKKFTK